MICLIKTGANLATQRPFAGDNAENKIKIHEFVAKQKYKLQSETESSNRNWSGRPAPASSIKHPPVPKSHP
jgi:hypothetical protein